MRSKTGIKDNLQVSRKNDSGIISEEGKQNLGVRGLRSSRIVKFNIINTYTIFAQQQDTHSTQVPTDCKLGDTGSYPGT